ncbi:FtsX-like permease family protein [Candidatus Gracilibacteria bacterium]|nr:FtsX-like permease family protein [Candidatus Gracilibacteria bacterium]NJM88482.1 FtsX-like permease family protein [Hydrococcus sp. RU_2_2]NJP19913.1 FtsX-like permease family protein [Hydrococcus sp. CRU_1_1]
MGLPIADLLFMTWKSLSSNLLRSGLSSLGVFMGVAAVNTTLNIQTISSTQIAEKLALRDKPYILPILISEFGEEIKLTQTDRQALKQSIPNIRSISTLGYVGNSGSVQFEDRQLDKVSVNSVSLNYLETTGRKMVKGRFFNRADFDQYRQVVIVDEKLAFALFRGQNPLNQAIFSSNLRLIVIGVTQSRLGDSDPNVRGTLWITENFANALEGEAHFNEPQISPHRLEDITNLATKVQQILSQRYPQMSVYVEDNAGDLLREKETQEIANYALAGVGLIALVIAGVGIANITVASVIERTKEIGIRRALGASQLEVMLQFILEAILLSIVGGVIAIATVHSLTHTATTTVIQAPYKFSSRNAGLSMGAALLVGVGSSFFPALRATRVDIIKALRSE